MSTKDRFYINRETFLWDCKICGRNGNFQKFLNEAVIAHQTMITGAQLLRLSKEKSLRPQTLKAWGVGWSGLNYTWPARGNPTHKITDIRRFKIGGKVLATSGGKLSLICPLRVGNTPTVWLAEGDWDGMALWECLRALAIKDDVYASPGAGILPKVVLELFEDKDVIGIYDHDSAGQRGLERLNEALHGIAKSIRFVVWPEDYKDGFDFRDFYVKHKRDPKQVFGLLQTFMKETPVSTACAPSKYEPLGDGMLHKEVYTKFENWLHLETTEPIDIVFGSVFANRLSGDPLWLFLVAPPGGTKTELLMSMCEAPLIYTTTSLTPHALVSGANFGGRDPSLIPKLDGKVLVVKDFTTILAMNSMARDEIFGTLRDAYDGQTEKQFGNGVVRKYRSKFGIVAGVTPAIESLHSASISLGERFLKYRISHGSGRDAVRRALQNVNKGDEMREELCEVSRAVLDYEFESIPEMPQGFMDKIILLAEWTALLRGIVSREKYTQQVNYKPMSELGTRLAKQLSKLAYGISIFKRELVISKTTFNAISKTARDTIPDRIEEVVQQLYKHKGQGKTKEVSRWTKLPEGTVRFLLQDMELLHIVKSEGHLWRLDDKIIEMILELELYKTNKQVRRRKK
jgi:hypothetical protein